MATCVAKWLAAGSEMGALRQPRTWWRLICCRLTPFNGLCSPCLFNPDRRQAGWSMALAKFMALVFSGFVGVTAFPLYAQQAQWEVITQPGGYKVARGNATGSLTGVALTCERNVPVIAISLAKAPKRNPAQVTMSDGSASYDFGVIRNGTTNVWVATVKNPRLVEMLASAQIANVTVEGAQYGSVSLSGSGQAIRNALSGCWKAPPVAAAVSSVDADQDAVRAIIGRIYGWRDGRKVAEAGAEDWEALFTPRIAALHADCEAGVERADPKSNGGEGAYLVTGDQGCLGVPFLLEPVTYDAAPFIPQTRPVIRRTGADTIESEITVPAQYRAEWGASETIRFNRVGGRWLVDEVVTKRADKTYLYSGQIGEMIAELRKIAKKPAGKRKG